MPISELRQPDILSHSKFHTAIVQWQRDGLKTRFAEMNTVMVTGTDTEVGKTYVSTVILKQLKAAGLSLGAYKPVCSGAVHDQDGKQTWSDVDKLAEAIQWTGPQSYICPQRFSAAVAPNTAASKQNMDVDELMLTQGAQVWLHEVSHLLIEGAGGFLSPVSDLSTNANIAEAFASPVVVVAANRLGTINHTALTVEAIKRRGLSLNAIIVNDLTDNSEDDESMATNAAELQRVLPNATILRCGYQQNRLQFAQNPETDITDERLQQLMFRC